MAKKFKADNKKIFEALTLLTQISITMIVTIMFSFFIGRALDNWFLTEPVFLLIFIVLGVMAAFRNVYKLTHHLWYKKDKAKNS